MSVRKVILFISMSIDGYLATKDDGLDWLSVVEKKGEDYGHSAMSESADTYIVGRKTYDIVKSLCNGKFPPAEQYDCYVLTREKRTEENGVSFYNGNIEQLISKLKKQPGKHIYCDGGGQVVKLLMDNNLIDEYIISIIPVFLGEGKRLFLGGVPQLPARLLSHKAYDTGLVQLRYEKKE